MQAAYAAGITGTTPQTIMSMSGYYCGIAVRETAGSNAVVRIYDSSATASGKIVDVVALKAGESVSDLMQNNGIRVENGIVLQIVSGSIEGSVRFA